jgi:SAM-dependent methyltransferase
VCGEPVPVPEHSIEDKKVVTCTGCGVGVTFPEPTRDIVSDGLFVEMYGGQRLALRPQWYFEAESRVRWLMMYAPDGVLMEVGCGTGEFAAVAAAAGYDTYAVEPSTWAAQQAAELGLRVTVGDVGMWCDEHPGELIDVAVAFHVLEHLHDPVAFLQQIRQAMRPGGTLAIEVPNYACQAAGLDAVAWAGPAIADHVYHYTPESLRVVLEAGGFRMQHHVEFSTRVYDSPAMWAQRRHVWRQSGIAEPNLDMLRAIAIAIAP